LGSKSCNSNNHQRASAFLSASARLLVDLQNASMTAQAEISTVSARHAGLTERPLGRFRLRGTGAQRGVAGP
jgi:hypothetical protein